jgi:hypothetical protein
VIERLTSSLRDLASRSAADLASERTARLRGDCADAVRLELDCPQQSLTAAQRAALMRLSDALEGAAPAHALLGALRDASAAIMPDPA